MSDARASAASVLLAVLGLACSRATPTVPETTTTIASELDMSAPATLIGEVVELRLLDADGRPLADVALGLHGSEAPQTDADGRVCLVLTHAQLAAPVVYLRATLPDETWLHAAVPSSAVDGLTLQLPAEPESDWPLQIVLDQPNPSVQAWFDVAAWAASLREAWKTAESVDAKLAVWARAHEDIEAESDHHVRGLMMAAQFTIGRGDPDVGLEREAAAKHALEQLALDDPRWAIWPPSLVTAAWGSGLWDGFDRLDEQIGAHPQPEVASYVMVERYMWALNQGRWQQAESMWAQWQARPELHTTLYAKLVDAAGPDRRLAPGRHLPKLCAETLDGDRVCTDALVGLTVVEFYAVWCRGCRDSFPKVAATVAGLAKTEPQPQLLTIEVYNDRYVVESFVAEVEIAGRHAWVSAAERDAIRDELQLESVPTMVIVAPDGRILDSTPLVSAENLDERLRHWQEILAARP